MPGIDIEGLIESVGYIGIFLIVFAETGLLIGFFLPGDTLLLTCGLLSERGARILAPAYGYVAARPDATWSAVCDEVARVVASATGVPAARLRAVHCRLARGDKAIFAFEDRDGSGQPSIAVVSEDPRVTRGRRIEADILAQLARLPADISRRVPRHVGEYAVGRYACFVMTMLPGVTLDAATASLEPLTQQALDFLRALHLHTATPVRLDAERFQRYVGNLVADACARNRDEAAALIELRDALSAALGNRTLPVVFTHGDFKIENVMYTRADRRMTGVIDWEHASSQALPLIDPLYLLFYNRTLRGSPWMEVLAAVVDRQALDARELERVDGYLRALGVDTELFEPLAAVFLIHHIGRRVTLTLDADAHERLRRIIDGLAARLRATAQSGGGGQKLS